MTSILRTLAIVVTLGLGIALLPEANPLPSIVTTFIDLAIGAMSGTLWLVNWNTLWLFAQTVIFPTEILMLTVWLGLRLLKFIR